LSSRTYRLVNSDEQLHGLCIDISDLDTTFMGEQDPITFTRRVDTDVVLGLLGMREERLEDERVECSRDLFNLTRLSGTLLDPFSGDLVVLVDAEETGLSSTLDQLIGLGDELV
jgi:hypothetical protein